MQVYFNGRFVELERAVVGCRDRGFAYGDGLFEAILVHHRLPFRWDAHWDRFCRTAAYLRIPVTLTPAEALEAATNLISLNQIDFGVIRPALSRGPGPRGLGNAGCGPATLIMDIFPLSKPDLALPTPLSVRIATHRLFSGDPLNRMKTTNRLPWVLARLEADEHGMDDALLINELGDLVESTTANFFWWDRDILCHPHDDEGGLPGITRQTVIEIAKGRGIPVMARQLRPEQLLEVSGAFLTMTSRGIVPLGRLGAAPIPQTAQTEALSRLYWNRVAAESHNL